jgi:hypothetical protein
VDEFDKADRSDYELDRADEQAIREQDWADLHGEYEDRVWAYEAQWRADKKAQAERSAALLKGVEEGQWKTSGDY